MKFDKMKLALAAIGLINLSQVAIAGNSTTVGVSAVVPGLCKFSQTSGSTMNFGTVDPSTGTAAATATAGLSFQCTKNTSSAATITGGGTTLVSSTNSMSYSTSLTSATQTGAGFGANPTLTMTLNGSIPLANYQAAVAGTYTDTVVVAISP